MCGGKGWACVCICDKMCVYLQFVCFCTISLSIIIPKLFRHLLCVYVTNCMNVFCVSLVGGIECAVETFVVEIIYLLYTSLVTVQFCSLFSV